MRLVVTLARDEIGMIVAEYPAISGCVSQLRTEDEALANVLARRSPPAWSHEPRAGCR